MPFLYRSMPCLKRLVFRLHRQGARFDPRSIHVGFVVDNVALNKGFLRVVGFIHISIISPVLHANTSVHHRRNMIVAFYRVFN